MIRKVWNKLTNRSQPTVTLRSVPAPVPSSGEGIATRYSITHTIGQAQRMTLWGAGSTLTIDLPDETAQHLAASLTSGVIGNRRQKRKAG